MKKQHFPKYIFLLLSLLIVLALTVTACSNPTPPAQEQPKQAQPPSPVTKTDSGRYVGQIDSNFIEIEISGVPAEHAAKAFGLTDSIKENFEKLGLETGDEVIFEYTVPEVGNPIITEIRKLK